MAWILRAALSGLLGARNIVFVVVLHLVPLALNNISHATQIYTFHSFYCLILNHNEIYQVRGYIDKVYGVCQVKGHSLQGV